MLPTYVRLHDIEDAEGFVAATIERSGLRLRREEHEDLLAEGLAILCELAGKFEPHRPGYERPGTFSGFAAQFLPRRLGDAWHRRHPEHRRVTRADGKREWQYHRAPVSLDGLSDDARGQDWESQVRPPSQWAPAAGEPARC